MKREYAPIRLLLHAITRQFGIRVLAFSFQPGKCTAFIFRQMKPNPAS
jgi:hypothetical protein